MKTVVILAPDFSPSSYPPALRARFFAQHLPEFGWKPIIVATDPHYYETAVDPENNTLLPPDLEVVRTRALQAKWTRRFGLGDLGWRSIWHNWQALSAIIRERKPDVLYMPTPPSAGLLLGRLAQARFGVPYILDLIDPIATDYYWSLPRSQRPPKWWLAYWLTRFVERTSLRRASHITAVDATYANEALLRYGWLSSEKVTGIPYGGETSDFDFVMQSPRTNHIFDNTDGLLHCSYVGVVGPYMLATINALLLALKFGLQHEPALFRRVRLHFVGTNYNPDARCKVIPLAEDAGVADQVTEHPARVPYLDAIQLLLCSDVILALGSEEAHYTASKIFPCIMANRPLLAILHQDSSAVRILRETSAAEPITFRSAGDLGHAAQSIYERWRALLTEQHAVSRTARLQAFAPYTTRVMAQRLAGVFDSLTAAPNGVAVRLASTSATGAA